jgi:hypothetical protein
MECHGHQRGACFVRRGRYFCAHGEHKGFAYVALRRLLSCVPNWFLISLAAKRSPATRRSGSPRTLRSCQGCCEMLSGGAEPYLVHAETSSLDAVSVALNAETAEVAAGKPPHRHSHSYSHSRHRIRRPALVFGRVVVVRHVPCRRHGTSPN